MLTREEHAERVSGAFANLVITASNGDDVSDATIKLRSAINATFSGTKDARYSIAFVERNVPYGQPLTEKAKERIQWLIGAIEKGDAIVFKRERLIDLLMP